MRRLTLVLLFVLLAALMVAPVAAQEALPDFIQHSDCQQDLTGQEIPIYHFGDLSGSYAFITQPLLAGLADAMAYFNARGGVCGANLVSQEGTHYRDTAGDPNQVGPAYDYMSTLDPKPTLLVLYASGDAERLRDRVEQDGIPVIISAGSVEGLYGEDGQTPGWIYATNPLYADQFGAFCKFVSENPEMYPDPVIGYLSWGIAPQVAAFGEAAWTEETRAYCQSLGVGLVETAEYFLPLPTADLTNNVLNLIEDGGANIIYTNSLAIGPVLVARFVEETGYGDTVKVAGVNWALDTTVGLLSRTALGSDGLPVVNGLVGSMPFHWWTETSIPGVALINEQAEANERPLPTRNIAYLLGWGLVDTYVEVYIQTVNRVGSLEAVTGADVKETIETIDYSPLGLYAMNYDGGAIRAVPSNRMAQIAFLNADGTGPAASGDDAMKIPQDDGTTVYVPIIIPLTEFSPAPDLRPGGADVPAS